MASSTKKRRAGLGRGLAAILPETPADAATGELLELPVDLIKPNPNQPRTHFDPDALAGPGRLDRGDAGSSSRCWSARSPTAATNWSPASAAGAPPSRPAWRRSRPSSATRPSRSGCRRR